MSDFNLLLDVGRKLSSGHSIEAHAIYREYLRRNPASVYPKTTTPGAVRIFRLVPGEYLSLHSASKDGFRVTLGGACESDHFVHAPEFQTITYYVLDDTDPAAIVSVAAHAHIVFNAIADADCQGRSLEIVRRASERLQMPILNHPNRALLHQRDALGEALSSIPDIHMPKTVRVAAASHIEHGVPFPLIARVSGTHTGATMKIVKSDAELAAYQAQYAPYDLYLTEFVDFKSRDGWYRKYRASVIDGEVIPNHLFCNVLWNVHGHASRNQMKGQKKLLDEELVYVETPLSPTVLTAFKIIHKLVGTDFYGIDYALSTDGAPIIFEVNAAMRSIYPEWAATYPITQTVTAKLVAKFRAMLAGRIAT